MCVGLRGRQVCVMELTSVTAWRVFTDVVKVTEVLCSLCRVFEFLQKSSVVSVGYWNCHRTYRDLCRVLNVSQNSQKLSVGYLQRVTTPGTVLWVPYRTHPCKIRLHGRRGKGMAESFSRETSRHALQKEGG